MFQTPLVRDPQSVERRSIASSVVGVLVATACGVGGNDTAGSGLEPGSVEWKIENAMSAAPAAIAGDATIMDWPTGSDPAPIVLREGDNGWVCYPTSPDVPLDDPKCLDTVGSLWSQAVETGQVPTFSTMGIGYMLAGGGTASVSDPSLRGPPDGEDWRVDAPHITLHFPPGALDATGLPEHPGGGGPWVKWASSPWAHIMVPVGPATTADSSGLEPGTPEWETWDAERAAPEGVSSEATVVSWAAGAGSEPLVLRTGTNGWTCFPASPATPADDPTCGNEAWSRWFEAWASNTVPDLHAIGFSYWLRPSSAASNDDPSLLAPEPGQDWIPHPPELSVHFPDELLPMAVFSSDQGTGGPWIMFAGTPYSHLMIPIR
jgi:hypothetical protein